MNFKKLTFCKTLTIKAEIIRVYNRGLNTSMFDLNNVRTDNGNNSLNNITYCIKIVMSNLDKELLMFVSLKDGVIYYTKDDILNDPLFIHENNQKIIESLSNGNFDISLINCLLGKIFEENNYDPTKLGNYNLVKYDIISGFIRKDKILRVVLKNIVNTLISNAHILNNYIFYLDKFSNEYKLYKYSSDFENKSGILNIKLNGYSNTVKIDFKDVSNVQMFDVKLSGLNNRTMKINSSTSFRKLSCDDIVFFYTQCIS